MNDCQVLRTQTIILFLGYRRHVGEYLRKLVLGRYRYGTLSRIFLYKKIAFPLSILRKLSNKCFTTVSEVPYVVVSY
jgi:hypothetical protein